MWLNHIFRNMNPKALGRFKKNLIKLQLQKNYYYYIYFLNTFPWDISLNMIYDYLLRNYLIKKI